MNHWKEIKKKAKNMLLAKTVKILLPKGKEKKLTLENIDIGA